MGELTAEQRRRLLTLLHAEIERAERAARHSGASAEELARDRAARASFLRLSRSAGEDRDDSGGDAGELGGVGD